MPACMTIYSFVVAWNQGVIVLCVTKATSVIIFMNQSPSFVWGAATNNIGLGQHRLIVISSAKVKASLIMIFGLSLSLMSKLHFI